MNKIFAGMPSKHIQDVILRRQEENNLWNKIVRNLEDFSDNMIGNELPAVGSTSLSAMYDIGDEQTIPLTWQVLGYNSSIPRYVKYKDQSGNKIYVSSMKAASNGDVQGYLLSAIAENDPVYVKNSSGEYETNGKIIDSADGSFTYGQTKEVWGTTATDSGFYSVPTSIVVDNKSYTFAGYNMTLATKGTIGAIKDSKYYNRAECYRSLNPYETYTNAWSDSRIRSWLNGTKYVGLTNWFWYYDYNTVSTNVGDTLPAFITRFSNDSCFINNVVQVVNKTWVWGTNTWNTLWNKKVLDGKKCEHVVDKFWLLGFGHLDSGSADWTNDYLYDTARYTSVFTEDVESKIRYQMNIDGSISAVPRNWRLHSSFSRTYNEANSYNIGYIDNEGYISVESFSNIEAGALLPACTIG